MAEWKFVANIIRKRIQMIEKIEGLSGSSEYTSGAKDSLRSLLVGLAEYYDKEGLIDIKTLLSNDMPNEYKVRVI